MRLIVLCFNKYIDYFSVFRFSVLLEVVKPEKPDLTVFLKGDKFIEVPALAKRDYTMSFNAYKEGEYTARVWANKFIYVCASMFL